ncbi:MAG: hypothetical protein RLZZ142_2396 [Verrucomicrobiota bacterium]
MKKARHSSFCTHEFPHSGGAEPAGVSGAGQASVERSSGVALGTADSADGKTGAVLLEGALEVLRKLGHRITSQRRALLAVLTNEHGPFTAEELHRKLADHRCDPVTVYRSLTALEDANLVRRCDFGDGVYRYEFNTGDQHHHHIICRSCGSVRTLEVCFADALERMVRQMGYERVTHTLEIFGVCQSCQRNPRTPAGGTL